MSAPIGRVSIKAPTLELQDQFVARLKTAIALKTFREIREVQDLRKESTSQPSGWLEGLFHKDQPEDDLSGLKDSIGEGLVFDFTPLVWEIQVTEASISAFAPLFLPTGNPTVLHYVAQGRLVRLDGPGVLWKAVCSVRLPFQIQMTATPYELAKDPNSVLHLKRVEAAIQCSDELLKKALG